MAREPRRKSVGADYEVGFGKPPEGTRFQKGRSGNPGGRPGGSKNVGTLLAEALDETVVVKEDGRRGTITKRAAIVKQLVNRSAGADLAAMRMLLGLVQAVEGRADPGADSAEPGAGSTSEADQQVMRELQRRLLRSGGSDDA